MLNRRSYPNVDAWIPQEPSYDKQKWLDAARKIYASVRHGHDRAESVQFVTNDWDVMERNDFNTWLRFYEGQNHMKYKEAEEEVTKPIKKAQRRFYDAGSYVIPIAPDPVPPYRTPDKNHVEGPRVSIEDSRREEEKKRKELIEEHRKKIISRLQAASRLLKDTKGRELIGEDWKKVIDILHELEVKFHDIDKKSASNRIYEDLIIRKANVLVANGMVKSSEFLMSIAQGLPGTAIQTDPFASVPLGGAKQNDMPSDVKVDPSADVTVLGPDGKPNAMARFLENMNGADDGATDEDDDDADDHDDENDAVEIDNAEDDNLVIEAQAVLPVMDKPEAPKEELAPPEPKPITDDVKPEEPKAEIEVTDSPQPDAEELLKAAPPPKDDKDFDHLIDLAFSNLKVSDIVRRLDELSRIFKNREIARKLSIVDMMMDKLGLSSFFPSLAEATRSALESNQYALVRVEDVKSRLSGAMDHAGKSLHDMGEQHSILNQQEPDALMGDERVDSEDPLLEAVKNNLETQNHKDKLKKELRKNIEENNLLESGDKEEAKIDGLQKSPSPKQPPVPVKQ